MKQEMPKWFIVVGVIASVLIVYFFIDTVVIILQNV